ncbi:MULTISPECIES: MarR family winged helix-turn-helix transcriptional regulator [Actinomycetes]|uniref:MarR family winged helix-turn-helix transcriptional regulator n=1 Tax=Actinomycetes TaxID=1760 RepID=UPI0010A93A02|nr:MULTISPECIES: MarR family transcriptional regulator [Actinomycetes]
MAEEDVSVLIAQLNAALRAWFGAFNELGRQFALHVGMHGNDATALVHITSAEDRDVPLSQVELGRRLGLSAAATSTLLSRLEDAGHINRHRGVPDKRTVTLRATPAVHDKVQAFFRSVGTDLDSLAATYPPDILASTTELVTAMTGVLTKHLAMNNESLSFASSSSARHPS